jgi:hypothetical protein
MDIGKLFKDAWGLFVKDIGPLLVGTLIASIIPAVAGVALGLATFGASMSGLEVNDQGAVNGFGTLNWVLLAVGLTAIGVVSLFLSAPLFAGLVSGVTRRVREGRAMGYGDAFAGFHIFGRVIGASILLGIVYVALIVIPTALIVAGAVAGWAVLVAIGVIVMLAAIVLYIYLIVVWVYVFPVIVDRGAEVMPSLSESRRLVHGSGWWWTLLVLFLLQLAVGAASVALNMVPFVGSVAVIVTYPFMLTYIVAMYFQARGEGGLVDAVLAAPAAQQWTAPPGAPPYPPVVSGPATPMIASPPPPPPPPPGPVDVSAWKAASDPLAPPPSPAVAGGDVRQAPVAADSPAVDGASGQLENHCSQCGALIGGSEEYCQTCALEVSGGEPAAAPPPADATESTLPHTPPLAPEAPQPPDAPMT